MDQVLREGMVAKLQGYSSRHFVVQEMIKEMFNAVDCGILECVPQRTGIMHAGRSSYFVSLYKVLLFIGSPNCGSAQGRQPPPPFHVFMLATAERIANLRSPSRRGR